MSSQMPWNKKYFATLDFAGLNGHLSPQNIFCGLKWDLWIIIAKNNCCCKKYIFVSYLFLPNHEHFNFLKEKISQSQPHHQYILRRYLHNIYMWKEEGRKSILWGQYSSCQCITYSMKHFVFISSYRRS